VIIFLLTLDEGISREFFWNFRIFLIIWDFILSMIAVIGKFLWIFQSSGFVSFDRNPILTDSNNILKATL
jgi:hypothetical protein